MEKIFCVLAFESTHHAIMMEKKLKDKIKIDTIPTPREISASCGLSIKFNCQDLEKVKQIIEKAELKRDMMSIYRIERINSLKDIKMLKWG